MPLATLKRLQSGVVKLSTVRTVIVLLHLFTKDTLDLKMSSSVVAFDLIPKTLSPILLILERSVSPEVTMTFSLREFFESMFRIVPS